MMMKLFLFLSVLLVTSCADEQGGDLPQSKGLPCELVVVSDDALMRSPIHDSIMLLTDGPSPGLAGNEHIFRTTHLTPGQYIPAYYGLHSQIFFRINKKLKQGRIGVDYDTKARPQIVVTVEAPSVQSMLDFIGRNRRRIQYLLYDFQVRRLAAVAKGNLSQRVFDELRQVGGYTVCVPSELVATKRGQNFLWAGTNRNQEDMNFLFYTYPWDEADAQPVMRFVEQRDSVLRTNIPGGREGQWMTTARTKDNEPVVWARSLQADGRNVTEVRGLWELHGGYMGGPFVALVGVDTTARRTVVAEAFVYNPQGNKRDLMRRMEGALQTLKKEKP